MSKKNRNRNPLLKKKYDEGFSAGVRSTINYFADKIETLHEVEGIGAKTLDKIKEHFESGSH